MDILSGDVKYGFQALSVFRFVNSVLLFTAELRTLLRSYGPRNYGRQGFCPIAEGNLIGKTRYVRSLKGCEQ